MGKYETGWGKCGKKKGRVRMKSVRVVTRCQNNLLEVSIEALEADLREYKRVGSDQRGS